MPDVEFLSDEWIDALDAAARDRPPVVDDPLASIEVTIAQRVIDGPSWRLVVDRGAVSVVRGDEPADVRLTSDRATAAAIASGRRAALDAFISGDLRLGGDVSMLLEHRAALEALGDVFARVGVATDFDVI